MYSIYVLVSEVKTKSIDKRAHKADEPIEENVNRIVVDGPEARSIVEAISILR